MYKDFGEASGYAGTRQLLKGQEGEWVDIVHWESLEDAQKAQEAAMGSETCMPMFHKITPTVLRCCIWNSKKTGNNFEI